MEMEMEKLATTLEQLAAVLEQAASQPVKQAADETVTNAGQHFIAGLATAIGIEV